MIRIYSSPRRLEHAGSRISSPAAGDSVRHCPWGHYPSYIISRAGHPHGLSGT